MPSQGVVYQVVRDHFETFRAQAAGLRDGEGLPRFVEQAAFAHSAPASLAEALAEAGVSRVAALRMPGRPPSRVALRRASPKPWRRREFRALLRCGCLAGGFARFRCDDCGLDRLVPFSCKGTAVCASCGPSTRREPQGRREPGRTATMLRAVPSNVEGRRATDGGTRRAPGRPRVPGGAGAAVGADAAASAALPAGVGSRPLSRGRGCLGSDGPRLPAARGPPGWGAGRARRSRGPSTSLRTIPSEVEGWRSFSASAGR